MDTSKLPIIRIVCAVALVAAIRWGWNEQAAIPAQFEKIKAQLSHQLVPGPASPAPSAAPAAPSPDAAKKFAPEVYAAYEEASGIVKKLNATNQAVFAQLSLYLDNTSLAPDQKSAVLDEARKNLDENSLNQAFQTQLAAVLNASEMQDLAEAHKHPLLQKVSAREDQILTADGNQKLAAFLQSQDPAALNRRTQLLTALDEEFDLYADAAKLYELAIQPYRDGAFSKFGQSPEMLLSIETYLKSNMKQGFISSLVYLAQDLSDQDVRTYVELSRSRLMLSEQSALIATYGAAINRTSQGYQNVLSTIARQ